MGALVVTMLAASCRGSGSEIATILRASADDAARFADDAARLGLEGDDLIRQMEQRQGLILALDSAMTRAGAALDDALGSGGGGGGVVGEATCAVLIEAVFVGELPNSEDVLHELISAGLPDGIQVRIIAQDLASAISSATGADPEPLSILMLQYAACDP
jgi:hypothetical protein